MTRPPFFPNLDHRANVPELMDSFEADPQALENTLRLFGVINRCATRVRHVLKKYVIRVMRENPQREYHLIDLGAGACETAAWLLEKCRRENLRLRVTACDHDPRVVKHAKRRFGDVPGLEILQRDVRDLRGLKPARFIFANHLLHHLDDDQVVELFTRLAEFEEATVLIDDLMRCRTAYTGYYILSAFFPRRSFARYDGLVSIMKGFRRSDVAKYIQAATPECQSLYTVKKIFPYRLIIVRKPMAGIDGD